MMKTSRLLRRSTSERGAAAVEFALVLPVLMLLVFGIIEFGFIFNRWVTVTHAAREGVRVYALTGDAAKGKLAAEASAPELIAGDSIICTGTPGTALDGSAEVSMFCETEYDLALFIFTEPITFGSSAKMREE